MKNVTISMDEGLAALARVAAAKQGISMSSYLRNLLHRELVEPPVRKRDPNNAQYLAVQRILAGPKWDVSENGKMPTSDERNARR